MGRGRGQGWPCQGGFEQSPQERKGALHKGPGEVRSRQKEQRLPRRQGHLQVSEAAKGPGSQRGGDGGERREVRPRADDGAGASGPLWGCSLAPVRWKRQEEGQGPTWVWSDFAWGCCSKEPQESKLVQPLWKTVWRVLKALKIELPYDLAIALLGIYPEDTKMLIRGTHAPQCLFIAALSTVAQSIGKSPNVH